MIQYDDNSTTRKGNSQGSTLQEDGDVYEKN